jgi:glycosyltransferase involved in cell wall biosynthesis
MKILWFTNIPLPAVKEYFDKQHLGTGGWVGALLDQLKNIPELQLGVVVTTSLFPSKNFSQDGVDYFIIQQKGTKIRRQFFPVDNSPQYVRKCASIVNSFQPDIIHIHGTENFFGEMMLQGLVNCPIVFSLQGLMDSYSEWYRYFGKTPAISILADNFLDTIKGSGFLLGFLQARRQAKRERRYLQQGKFFFGRTTWDKATSFYYNDQMHYYIINEVLRKPFWQKSWQLASCNRHRIIFTNARHPRKGTELLLDAVKRLLPLYPDLELILIGSLDHGGYSRSIQRKIDKLRGVVRLLGFKNAEEITDELCKAHVFVSASYIDNSPNSVAEAQLVGTPVISSYTGGVPSLVGEYTTGLLFPTGDIPLLVNNIIKIFENDALAESLSAQARQTARNRHDPATIISAQVAAYKDILNLSNLPTDSPEEL